MAVFIKDRWLLLLVILVFVALKIPHLHYSYYWDESWPYATAIRSMHDNGISLMPNAIDPEISRGHPLLFHAAAALWMKVFGASHEAMHSFALLISVLFLITIYEAGLRLFNVRVAFFAIILVSIQEVFFVQSSSVLLEMMVAFLGFSGLYYYVRGKYFLTSLFLTALFYTKESGLILGFVVGVDALASIFNKELSKRTIIYRLLSVGVPSLLAGVFFLLNKVVLGWYIFPFYSELIEHSWPAFWYKFRMCCVSDQFYSKFKYMYLLLLVVLGVIASVKTKKRQFLAVLLPVFFVFYFVDDMRAGRVLPSVPFFILFVAAWFWMVKLLSSKNVFAGQQQRRFVALVGSFILCFLCFSTMNYYIYRYLLLSLVPMFFVIAALFDLFITQSYRWLYFVVIPLFGIIAFVSISSNKDFGDADLGAYHGVDVHQHLVDFLEEGGYHSASVSSSSFLEQVHLKDPATGFIRKGIGFSNVQWEVDKNTEFVVFDNLEPDKRYESIKNDSASFQMVYRYSCGRVWGEIYKRK